MGLLQKALETYDFMEARAGDYEVNKEPLAPIGHICAKPSIVITIDQDGHFRSAAKWDAGKIIIPATLKSSSRSNGIEAHPLCDQIEYVMGDSSENEKKKAYLEQLKLWCDKSGDKKLAVIFKYVSENTVTDDLVRVNLAVVEESGSVKNKKDLICWHVVGLGSDDECGEVWKDKSLFASFNAFYSNKLREDFEKDLSMVSGTHDFVVPYHLKGVYSLSGNAKVISSNDAANFTFRGRFLNSQEAVSIGYEDSQKAHNALKWLIANQGKSFGDRVFVCWNSCGVEIQRPFSPFLSKEDGEKKTPSDYKNDLKRKVVGLESKLPEKAGVAIASFEAATKGRLAVTYYNEFAYSDFLDRLKSWDEECCFFDSKNGFRSPSISEIVTYAFGTQKGQDDTSRVEIDRKILGSHFQRLLLCRLERMRMPADIMRNLVCNFSSPLKYNRYNRRILGFIACCVVRKYRIDMFGEEWSMVLEPDKKNRSYQFGRLLAVMEKAEYDAFDRGEERDTNAIRMQNVFVRRPGYATKIIMEQLKNAYYPRLNTGRKVFYEKLIGEIMGVIGESGENAFNKPLDETYLLGYYLQKNELWSRKTDESSDKEKENE